MSTRFRSPFNSLRGHCMVDAGSQFFRHNALVAQIAAHALDELNLLVGAKSGDRQFQHVAHASLVHGNESVVVHVGEETHDELTVHTVGHASMSGDGVTEILDLEASLESRGEKTTEGSDEGSE